MASCIPKAIQLGIPNSIGNIPMPLANSQGYWDPRCHREFQMPWEVPTPPGIHNGSNKYQRHGAFPPEILELRMALVRCQWECPMTLIGSGLIPPMTPRIPISNKNTNRKNPQLPQINVPEIRIPNMPESLVTINYRTSNIPHGMGHSHRNAKLLMDLETRDATGNAQHTKGQR